MTKEFIRAYEQTVRGHEGGYANDPDDRGGETYCGISRKFHPQWSGWGLIDARNKLLQIKTNELIPGLDIHLLKFYHHVYWLQNRCQQMDPELGLTVFDMAINHGSGKAIELLQRALNAANGNQRYWNDIIVDGMIGDQTSGAILSAGARNKADQVNLWLNCLRGSFYIEIMENDNVQEKFATSWASRIRIERT